MNRFLTCSLISLSLLSAALVMRSVVAQESSGPVDSGNSQKQPASPAGAKNIFAEDERSDDASLPKGRLPTRTANGFDDEDAFGPRQDDDITPPKAPKPSSHTPGRGAEKELGRQIKMFYLKNAQSNECAHLVKKLFPNVDITTDLRTNCVLVASSDENRLSEIEALMEQLDASNDDRKIPSQIAPRKLKRVGETGVLKIVAGQSHTFVTDSNLQRMHVADQSIIDVVQYSTTEFSVVGLKQGTTTLAVWFAGDTDPEIYTIQTVGDPKAAKQDEPGAVREIKVFTPANGNANNYAEILKPLFANVKLSTDSRTNSIIAVSDKEGLQKVEALLLKLDEARTSQAPVASNTQARQNVVVRLQYTNAQQLADILKVMFPRDAIIPDASNNTLLISAEPERFHEIEAGVLKFDSLSLKTARLEAVSLWKDSETTAQQSVSTLEISQREADARKIADQIQHAAKTLGPKHPDMVKLHQDLDKALADVLALKFQHEQKHLQHLEQRLTRLRAQLQYRQANSRKIVDRHAREMLEGELTRWDPNGADTAATPPVQDKNATQETNGGSSLSSPVPDVSPKPVPEESLASVAVRLPTGSTTSFELGSRIVAANHAVKEAAEALKRAEALRESNVMSSAELNKAQRDLDAANQNWKLIKAEYAATLLDLQLQIEAAEDDVVVAHKFWEQYSSLSNTGTVSKQEVESARSKLQQAKISLQRVQVRYDFYKEAGKGLSASESKVEESLLNSSNIKAQMDRIWSGLGLRFGRLVDDRELHSSKYRGGLRIDDIAKHLEKSGIQKGDVLVGLDKWETISMDNVLWILQHVAANEGVNSLKFYILRDGHTRYGTIPFERDRSLKLDDPNDKPPAPALPLNSTSIDNRSDIAPSVEPEPVKSLTGVLKSFNGDPDLIPILIRKSLALRPNEDDRVASTILADDDQFDPSRDDDLQIASELATALKQLDREQTARAIRRTLEETNPRGHYVALFYLEPLKDHISDPEAPKIVDQLFMIAVQSNLAERLRAIDLLAETLLITKLKPQEFVSQERIQFLKQMSTVVPRDRVLKLLLDATDGQETDVSIFAAERLIEKADLATDPELAVKLTPVLAMLTDLIKGQRHATRAQRGSALGPLGMLKSHAAPAVPVLIDLFKSDDPDLKERDEDTMENWMFSRARIVQVCESIGKSAGAALPVLEAALAEAERNEKEESLLGRRSNRLHSPRPSASALRHAINAVHGAERDR